MHSPQAPARLVTLSSAMAGLVFGGILTMSAPAAAHAQQHDQHGDTPGQAAPAPRDNADSHSARHRMMEMHRHMMADHKAADAAVQSLIEKMNAATGDAKIEAMAAVVVELARQRTMMHNHMEHMTHMLGGLPGDNVDNEKPARECAGCPKMKGEAPRSPKP